MLYYSASANGFYDDGIHARMPDDCVAITARTHARLLAAQADGLVIVPGRGGAPVARPRQAPDAAQLCAQLRADRDARLSASDFSQMPDAPLTDAQRGAWRAYRQALRDLPATTTDPAAVAWPVAPA